LLCKHGLALIFLASFDENPFSIRVSIVTIISTRMIRIALQTRIKTELTKTGTIKQIHTGISGPGTGEYYSKFVEEFGRFMEKLERE